MISYGKQFLGAMITFMILDFVWLNYVMENVYADKMRDVATIVGGKVQINLVAGLVVYVFLAIGIVFFVLNDLSSEVGLLEVFKIGALFGFVVYGVYDFTNMATLKSWPLSLALFDIAWGIFATGLVSLVTYKIKTL